MGEKMKHTEPIKMCGYQNKACNELCRFFTLKEEFRCELIGYLGWITELTEISSILRSNNLAFVDIVGCLDCIADDISEIKENTQK